MTENELNQLLKDRFPKEDESVDWKGWQNLKQSIGGRTGDDAVSYISAFANMNGGYLIIGVDDKCQVIGIEDIGDYTVDNLKPRILGRCPNLSSEGFGIEEYIADDTNNRIWILTIPRHAPRRPVMAHDKAWQRIGDSLVELRPERHEAIVREPLPGFDWSAEVCPNTSIDELDIAAIEELRKRWSAKTGRTDYLKFDFEKTLRSLDLTKNGVLTNAAIILLGTEKIMAQVLPGAEIIFEWRQDPSKTVHDFRLAWRDAFLKTYNTIWNTINARNLRIPFQEGLIQREVHAFHEKSIREALLNAVAHRDYSIVDRSVFITASPSGFAIESPGGLLPGVTLENILNTKAWRNRLLMETLEKVGLVERSGQGMDDIYSYTISEGKGIPDISRSDASAFRLFIPATVRDSGFVRYLERVANEKQVSFSTDDLIDLERIKNGLRPLQEDGVVNWIKLGIIERFGKTRGSRFILSHRYYQQERRLGEHTRLSGLSREAVKALILDHLKRHNKGYMHEFQDAFPNHDRRSISNMLQELRRENKVQHEGAPKGGYWTLRN